MVTLNQLICHLENLRDYSGKSDIVVTVPIERDDVVAFEPLMELKDVDIYEIEVEGVVHYGVYLDAHQTLEQDEITEEVSE